jgi:hypothetical protein
MISFVDFDRQWIKSAIGLRIVDNDINRADSVDSSLMFPDAHELKLVLNSEKEPLVANLAASMMLDNIQFKFYIGAAIVVDGFKIGVMSLLDTKPHEYVSLDNRQNLLDLAAAVSNIVKGRRLRNLQLKRQRANLMLGLNHNLRTPVSPLVYSYLFSSYIKLITTLCGFLVNVFDFGHGDASCRDQNDLSITRTRSRSS